MSLPILKIFDPETPSPELPQPSGKAHRVLVVDDDAMIVQGLKETLAGQGYEVRGATHARDALDLLRRESFSLVLSDHRMPHMSGLELLAETKVVQPNATRVLITGVVNLQTVIEAINKGEIYRFIVKPWRQEELLISVKNGVHRYELICHNQELQRTTQSMNKQLASLNQCLEEKSQMEALQSHQLNELNRALSQNFQRSVELCFKTLQTFYPELGQQVRQVHTLCRLMVDELHLPDEQRQVLETSVWLHDIGLIGLPRDLVRQWQTEPDSLSPAQQQLIAAHPILGQELAAFVHHLSAAGQVIRAHHERHDGKGFPDALAGEEIPWLGRLLGIAAAYAAKKATHPDAMAQIRQESGTAFDPEAVRILQSCLKRLELPRTERTLPLARLQPGMTLAEDILTPHGWLLAPAGQVLGEAWITRLLRYNQMQPIQDNVSVHW